MSAVAVAVGDHLTRCGIDRHDPFLAISHAGFGDVPVRAAQLFSSTPTKQDLQLGEPKDERIVLIDEGDLDLIAQRVRQPGGQFQPTETGAEDQHLPYYHSSVMAGYSGDLLTRWAV